MMRITLLLLLALAGSSCAFKSTRLRKQAARDLGCHTFGVKVSVVRQMNNRYLARGCWQEAEYELDSDDMPRLVSGPRTLQR
jgi:hypothetical protein